MLPVFTAFATDYHLYGGCAQTLMLRELIPGKTYGWELRTGNNRLLGSGKTRAGAAGTAELQLETPAQEAGVVIKCRLTLMPDKGYSVELYSHNLFAPILPRLQQYGVWTDSAELKADLAAVGLELTDRDTARLVLVNNLSESELTALPSAGKTVIWFADGDNIIAPPPEKIRKITLETVDFAKKSPSLSVLYDKHGLQIGNEGGNGGLVDVFYPAGHLIVVAPELQRELNLHPDVWLILKHKIMEDLQKWEKEQLSGH